MRGDIVDKMDFQLLQNKDIIAILDGDRDFGEYKNSNDAFGIVSKIKIAMPYLSGQDICNLSARFGLYSKSGGSLSRWQYLDNLLAFCIKENKISNLLVYLFAKDRFTISLGDLVPNDIDKAYETITQKILEQINSFLNCSGNELYLVGEKYYLKKINLDISVATPAVKVIDRAYIKNLFERASNDIDEGNYDSAITKSRTILEETFCFVIEKKGDVPSESGDINKLYIQVKSLYNTHADETLDKRINILLSGLEKIVSAIAQMRNKESDSHGVGSKRIGISDYHARLFLNSSIAMADFILSIYLNSIKIT